MELDDPPQLQSWTVLFKADYRTVIGVSCGPEVSVELSEEQALIAFSGSPLVGDDVQFYGEALFLDGFREPSEPVGFEKQETVECR